MWGTYCTCCCCWVFHLLCPHKASCGATLGVAVYSKLHLVLCHLLSPAFPGCIAGGEAGSCSGQGLGSAPAAGGRCQRGGCRRVHWCDCAGQRTRHSPAQQLCSPHRPGCASGGGECTGEGRPWYCRASWPAAAVVLACRLLAPNSGVDLDDSSRHDKAQTPGAPGPPPDGGMHMP